MVNSIRFPIRPGRVIKRRFLAPVTFEYAFESVAHYYNEIITEKIPGNGWLEKQQRPALKFRGDLVSQWSSQYYGCRDRGSGNFELFFYVWFERECE